MWLLIGSKSVFCFGLKNGAYLSRYQSNSLNKIKDGATEVNTRCKFEKVASSSVLSTYTVFFQTCQNKKNLTNFPLKKLLHIRKMHQVS